MPNKYKKSEHRYFFDGIEYPSVTTITGQLDKSAGLLPWAVGCAMDFIRLHRKEYKDIESLLLDAEKRYREVSQEALDIGSEVHYLIERYIQHDKDVLKDVRDEVMQGVIAFFEWEKENNVEWIESEIPVFNNNWGYAGKFDAIAKVNNKVYVIDFKTSKRIYPEAWLQVAAYKEARESMYKTYEVIDHNGDCFTKSYNEIEVDGVGILRLDKLTGLPEWKEKTDFVDIRNDYEIFISFCIAHYKTRKKPYKNNPGLAKQYKF
jgi:hypothetical protein